MKVAIFFFIYLFSSVILLAQTDLNKKISLDLDNTSLEKALKKISTEYGVLFSYNPKKISVHTIISKSYSDKAIYDVLNDLLSEIDAEYKVIEGQVVLKKSREHESEQKFYTLSGYLKDRTNGEVMYGATVFIDELKAGTATNEYGFFSLAVPKGEYTIRYSYLGYNETVEQINVHSNVLKTVALEYDKTELSEIEIVADNELVAVQHVQMNNYTLSPKDISQTPQSFGVANLGNVVEEIPGISTFGDVSSSFYVRGGTKDQNLILLDDAPLFNPSHMFGFFSTIVPEAISKVTVYKGDMPAELGNRASSIIDVRTKDGNNKSFELNGSVSPYSHLLSLEGPIWKNKISFITTYRKSNIQWLLGNDNDATLSFGDLTVKLNYQINANNRLYVSAYRGFDNVGFSNSTVSESGLKWGNSTNSLRWNRVFNEKLFLNTTIYGGSFDYKLYFDNEGTSWNSAIQNGGIKIGFSLYSNKKSTKKFGFEAMRFSVNPGNVMNSGDPVDLYQLYFGESSFYYAEEYTLNDRNTVKYGLRTSNFKNKGPAIMYTYNNENELSSVDTIRTDRVYYWKIYFQPRLGYVHVLNSVSSIKVGYTKNIQHINIISNSTSPFLSLETWRPTSNNIKPQISRQLSAGYYLASKIITLSIEGYLKRLDNMLGYRNNANLLLNPEVEAEVVQGIGKVVGLETSIKKQINKWTVDASYTVSHSVKKYDELYNGNYILDVNNRPHIFTVECIYTKSARFRMVAKWNLSSGYLVQLPVGYYTYQSHQVPVYSSASFVRLPMYHRLDLQVFFRLNKMKRKHLEHYLVVDLFNAYARKNAFSITFNKTTDGDSFLVPDNYIHSNTIVPTEISALGFIPSVSYVFKIK